MGSSRDIHNSLKVSRAISPQSVADNTALVSQIIDTTDYGSLEFLIGTGSLADADATFTVLVEHGDAANLSDAAAVPDLQLVGTESAAGFTFADDDAVRKVGYVGDKQYVRLTITPAANAAAALICALAVQSHAHILPTA